MLSSPVSTSSVDGGRNVHGGLVPRNKFGVAGAWRDDSFWGGSWVAGVYRDDPVEVSETVS